MILSVSIEEIQNQHNGDAKCPVIHGKTKEQQSQNKDNLKENIFNGSKYMDGQQSKKNIKKNIKKQRIKFSLCEEKRKGKVADPRKQKEPQQIFLKGFCMMIALYSSKKHNGSGDPSNEIHYEE